MFQSTNIRLVLHKVVSSIRSHGHGGSLWICPPGYIIENVLTFTHAVSHSALVGLMNDRSQRHRWAESVGQMTAIDGAVVLDGNANLLGCGAFIPLGSCETHPVYESVVGAIPRKVATDSIGGGRHQSAVTFCRTVHPSLAIVISQDGDLCMFGRTTADAIDMVRPPPVGDIHNTID